MRSALRMGSGLIVVALAVALGAYGMSTVIFTPVATAGDDAQIQQIQQPRQQQQQQQQQEEEQIDPKERGGESPTAVWNEFRKAVDGHDWDKIYKLFDNETRKQVTVAMILWTKQQIKDGINDRNLSEDKRKEYQKKEQEYQKKLQEKGVNIQKLETLMGESPGDQGRMQPDQPGQPGHRGQQGQQGQEQEMMFDAGQVDEVLQSVKMEERKNLFKDTMDFIYDLPRGDGEPKIKTPFDMVAMCELSELRVQGEKATAKLTAPVEMQDQQKIKEVHFVRINGTWLIKYDMTKKSEHEGQEGGQEEPGEGKGMGEGQNPERNR